MSDVQIADGRQLVAAFDTFMFDADGVLWLGDKHLPGAPEFLRHLVDLGKNVFIVTNNSTKTLDDYTKKCASLGFDMVPNDHILSPAKVLAHTLAKEHSSLPVYIVGSIGLQKELLSEGIESFGPGPDQTSDHTKADFIYDIDVSRPVRAVVVSYDVHISYPKIMTAANYTKQPGVQFYATNEDATLPGPVPGVILPGSGVNVKAVEVAAGRPPTVIGKPGRAMFDFIKDKFKISAKRSIMFGDRCETDIKFAHTNGTRSVLVGTGVHQLSDVQEFQHRGHTDLRPNYFTPSLDKLFKDLSK